MAANQPTKSAADSPAPTDAESPVNALPSATAAAGSAAATAAPQGLPAAQPTTGSAAPAAGPTAPAPSATPATPVNQATGAPLPPSTPTPGNGSTRPKRQRSTRSTTAATVAENQDRELVSVTDRIAAVESLLRTVKRNFDNERKLSKAAHDDVAKEVTSIRADLDNLGAEPSGTEARLSSLEDRARAVLALMQRVERIEEEAQKHLQDIAELQERARRAERDAMDRYNEFAAFVNTETHPDVDSLEYRLSDIRYNVDACLDENARLRSRLEGLINGTIVARNLAAIMARIDALEAAQQSAAPPAPQAPRSPSPTSRHSSSDSDDDDGDDDYNGRRAPAQGRSERVRPRLSRGRSPHRYRSVSPTRRHSRRPRGQSAERDDRAVKRPRGRSPSTRRRSRSVPNSPHASPRCRNGLPRTHTPPPPPPGRTRTPPPVAGPSTRPDVGHPSTTDDEGPVLQYYGEDTWCSLRMGTQVSVEQIPWGRAEQSHRIMQFWTENMDPLGGIPLPSRVERPPTLSPNWRIFQWETREQFLQFLSAWNERPPALRRFNAIPVPNLPPRDPAVDRAQLYPPPPPPRDNRRDWDRKGKGRDF